MISYPRSHWFIMWNNCCANPSAFSLYSNNIYILTSWWLIFKLSASRARNPAVLYAPDSMRFFIVILPKVLALASSLCLRVMLSITKHVRRRQQSVPNMVSSQNNPPDLCSYSHQQLVHVTQTQNMVLVCHPDCKLQSFDVFIGLHCGMLTSKAVVCPHCYSVY